VLSQDGKTLFITPAAATDDVSSRVRQELVVDVSQPFVLTQRPSIPVGASTGNHADALSPDGRSLFVANNVDSTVSEIDTATQKVVRTLSLSVNSRTMSLFGTDIGPSEQVGPIP
jgi:YVTN family beta-propeller protein